VFSTQGSAPTEVLVNEVNIMLQILVPLMITMATLAVVVYVAGQIFGAETRAKATVWAHGMLAAVGVSALIIGLTYALLPGFFAGNIQDFDVIQKIFDLRNAAATALLGLVMVMVVVAAAMYALGQLYGAEARARASGWANSLISGAVFAAVLYVVLSSIVPQFESAFFSGATLGVYGSYLGIYGSVVVNIVLFVSFFILITYLLSKVFKVPEWEAYLSIELSNLLSSFLIMLFVIGMFGVGTAAVIVHTGGAYGSPPQAAIAFIQGTVMDSALAATTDVYKIQACTSILSTFSKRIGEFVLTQTYKVFPGIDTFVNITSVLGMGLLTLYNTASVQAMVLFVVDVLVVPFFLPAGIILRFFPPTREAGSFLISVAFGFQIIYPGFYLINKQIYEEIGGRYYNTPGERPTILINSICGPFKYGVAGYLFNPSNIIFGSVPGGGTLGTMLSRVISEGLLNALSMAEFIPIMRHIASLSLLVIFMPALAMMVTIAFINAMTKFIVAKV
jgi:hypothetical protein